MGLQYRLFDALVEVILEDFMVQHGAQASGYRSD